MKHDVKIIYFKESGKYYSEGSYQSSARFYHEIISEVGAMMEERKLPGLTDGAVFDCVAIPEKEGFSIPYLFKVQYE